MNLVHAESDTHRRLIGRIERSLDECVSRFKKKDILSYCDFDSQAALKSIQLLADQGKIEILIPFSIAQDDDEVIRMKSYIIGKSPWPNWPKP